jgi:hypothetical protein
MLDAPAAFAPPACSASAHANASVKTTTPLNVSALGRFVRCMDTFVPPYV